MMVSALCVLRRRPLILVMENILAWLLQDALARGLRAEVLSRRKVVGTLSHLIVIVEASLASLHHWTFVSLSIDCGGAFRTRNRPFGLWRGGMTYERTGNGLLLRKALERLYSLNEFPKIELCISVEIHPSYDREKEVIVWDDSTLYEKALQIYLVDILIVPVVYRFEQVLHRVVVATRKALFESFDILRKLKLLQN